MLLHCRSDMVVINTPIDEQYLRASVPFLSFLTDVELSVIATQSSLQRYKRKERIVTQGSVTDTMYFVILGGAHVAMEDRLKRETIVSTLRPGDYFGEMSLIDHQPHVANVIAIKSTEILAVKNSVLSTWLPLQHSVASYLMQTLVLRLRLANRTIESLSLLDVRGRVARALLDSAIEDEHGNLFIRDKISSTDLGKMIGASRETVSRILSDFEARGLIKTESSGTMLLNAGGSLVY
jgi:CRP/FNR family cyclic AMP-dependent transcriptional regulator